MDTQALVHDKQAGMTPVHGVIDIRAYAARTAPTRDWLAGRASPAFADAAATVAAIAPVGEGRVAALRSDEFVLVLSGKIAVETSRGVLALETGQSAVLPSGLAFAWRAVAGAVAVIVACPSDSGTAAGVTRIDEAAPLEPSKPPLAELLVGPTPSCRNHTDYRSASGEFVCGTWDSTPYHRRPMTFRHIELMHLLEGAVTFQDASGSVTFSEGDVLLAARGAETAWISEVRVKKVYATQRPA